MRHYSIVVGVSQIWLSAVSRQLSASRWLSLCRQNQDLQDSTGFSGLWNLSEAGFTGFKDFQDYGICQKRDLQDL